MSFIADTFHIARSSAPVRILDMFTRWSGLRQQEQTEGRRFDAMSDVDPRQAALGEELDEVGDSRWNLGIDIMRAKARTAAELAVQLELVAYHLDQTDDFGEASEEMQVIRAVIRHLQNGNC